MLLSASASNQHCKLIATVNLKSWILTWWIPEFMHEACHLSFLKTWVVDMDLHVRELLQIRKMEQLLCCWHSFKAQSCVCIQHLDLCLPSMFALQTHKVASHLNSQLRVTLALACCLCHPSVQSTCIWYRLPHSTRTMHSLRSQSRYCCHKIFLKSMKFVCTQSLHEMGYALRSQRRWSKKKIIHANVSVLTSKCEESKTGVWEENIRRKYD